MCLDFIDESVKIPKSNIGYKIFLKLDDKLFHSTVYSNKSLPTNTLLHEFNYRPIGFWYSVLYCLTSSNLYCEYTRDKYSTGFHVYINKVDAFNSLKCYPATKYIKYGIYKVQFKKVVAKGYQYKNKVLVCKYIKILHQVKSK
jgi:hypothetical protein